LGQGAAEFLEGHHLDGTPFGPHSPFWRLADAGGKILIMGVGLSSVTSFHLTEDRMGEEFPVRVYLDRLYRLQCRDALGETVEIVTRCHDPFISQVRDCYIVEDLFIREGIYRKIPVGQHFIGMIDAQRMDLCLQRLARQERLTIYGRIWG
jgi:aminoglycoside 3-N-acetyltransferase